jgi:hypothetical protein
MRGSSMKIGNNYSGVNHSKEKARDNFAAELQKLKTEKIEDVDKVKRDFDLKLKHNVRSNREWAETTIAEKEKEFLGDLKKEANTYQNDKDNLIEDYEAQIKNLKEGHNKTMRQHNERTQSLLKTNTQKLNQDFENHLRKFKEMSRKEKMGEISDLYKNYKSDLKRESKIHKLQQNHSENIYKNDLIDLKSKQRVQNKRKDNVLQTALEDAQYEKSQLIRDYETKLGTVE